VPFTLSHPAAVLLMGRTGLPVAAMVAGSMAPDAPMFVPIPGSYGVTHSFLGVVTVDVVLGVLGVVVWFGLVRDALVDVAPAPVRERLAATARYSRTQWLLVPAAVVIGALTHVAWDLFTHPRRWGVEHVGWLREMHGGMQGWAWAQHLSTALGLVVAGVWAIGSLRVRPRQARPPRVPELGVKALAIVLLGTATLTGAASMTVAPDGLHAMAFRGAVLGTIALVVGLLALAMTWNLRARSPRQAAARASST
jgi:Domain of unknown function (DUF4184)